MKKLYLILIMFTFVLSVFSQNKKAGFLNVASSISAIADDDEKAAAQWFTTTYGGDYIPVSQVGTIDLSQYAVIWIYADNENGYADAPDEIYAVAGILSDYYKAGCNLLLTIYANNLLYEFGRADMWPNVTGGAGPGSENPDVWYVSPTYGTWDPAKTVYDRSSDPIYAGLTSETVQRGNGNNYPNFPLIGAGWKEDHNCFWTMDLADQTFNNDNEAKLTTWESTLNVTTLGTWGHVQDYFGSAITRWKPTDEFKGTCITIGLGAYEWNVKNGTNPYQANIERLTKNALDELKGIQSSVGYNFNSDMVVKIKNNTLSIENPNSIIDKIVLYTINGSLLKIYSINQIKQGVDISTLTQGVYVVKMIDQRGNQIAVQKIIK